MPVPDAQRRARRRPVVFGVLGGIAAGKSAVSARLAGPEGLVVDADALAREALESPPVQARLRAAYGDDVVGPDGRTRRDLVAERVFGSTRERRRLEGWIHPVVRARILAALDDAEERGVERVVLDVPLLLENDAQHGLVARCHHLVFVDAPPQERERRAVEGRGWQPGEVARRETAQLDLRAKRDRADHVVENDGSLEQLNAAVDRILADVGLA